MNTEDFNRSIFSIAKYNEGLFKSKGQYYMLTKKSPFGSTNSTSECWENMFLKQHVGNFFWVEGTVNWTPSEYHSAGKGLQRWAYAFFFDGKGLTAKYKIKFVGNLRDGSAPDSAKLVWERSSDTDGEDFAAILEENCVDYENRKQAERLAADDVVEGRQVFQGEVLSVKYQSHSYGGSYKMLVKLESGTKLYGSVPATIHDLIDGETDQLKGKMVSLTGTVSASDNDSKFGFFARPSKGSIL